MNNREYIEQATTTESHFFDCPPPRLLHSSMGLVTEAAELMDILKTYSFYGRELDLVHIIEELGDIFWYLAIICNELDTPFEEIMEKNIDKLKARYPEKFEQTKAIHRNLKAERDALERD